MEEGDEVTFNSRGSTIDWTFPGNRPAYVTIISKGAKGNPGGDGQAAVVTRNAQPGEPGANGPDGTAGAGGSGGAGGEGNDGSRATGGGGGGGGGAAGRSFVVYNWPLNDPNYDDMTKFTNSSTGERFYNFKSPNSFGASGQGSHTENYPIVQFSASPSPGDTYHGPQNPPSVRLGNPGSDGGRGQAGSGIGGSGVGGFGGKGGDGRASVTGTRSASQGSGANGQDGLIAGGSDGNATAGQPGAAGQPGSDGPSLSQPGASGQLAEATGGAAGQPGNRGGSAIFESITGPSIRHEFLGGDGGAGGVPAGASIAPVALGGTPGQSGEGNPGGAGDPGNPGGHGTVGAPGIGGQGGTLGRVAASYTRQGPYDFTDARQTTNRGGFFPDNRNEGVVETTSNFSSNWSLTWMGNEGRNYADQKHGRMGLGGMASFYNVGGNDLGGPGGQIDGVFVRERPNMTVPQTFENPNSNHPAKGYITRSGQPGGFNEIRFRQPSGVNPGNVHRLGTPEVLQPATTSIFNPYYSSSQSLPFGLGGVGGDVSGHEVFISVRRPLVSQVSPTYFQSVPGGLGGGDGKGGRGGDGGAGGSVTPDRSNNMVTGQVGGAGGGGSSGSFATLGYQGTDGADGQPGTSTLGQPGAAGQPAPSTSSSGLQPGQEGAAAIQAIEESVYVRAKQQFRVNLPNDDAGESFMTIRWSPH